ncbi:hypothetical protein [Atopococcus tabaci]|uniref:hypothetical protein n=1 Tax=Atopococcus tabaci TaxID=269774 RepID=UPI00240904D1|nr:hypothetical protein [Atopococcus tabaci]
MNGMEWADYIIKLASLMGAVGVLGNFLIKVYKKYVTDPDQKMAEKIQKEYTESLKASVAPLTESIALLNQNLQESQDDRKGIHVKLDNHEGRINKLEGYHGIGKEEEHARDYE